MAASVHNTFMSMSIWQISAWPFCAAMWIGWLPNAAVSYRELMSVYFLWRLPFSRSVAEICPK